MSSDHNFFEGAQGTDARGAQFNAAGRDINNIQFSAAGRDINYTYHANPSIDEEKILAALKPVEREGYPRVCMEGTRKDILTEIDRWLNDFTTPNILLLTGSPGAGKSTIAATVVSRLHQRRRLGSSFASKHSDTSLSDPSAVWRTVAADLSRFHPRVKDLLAETLKGVDPGWKDIGLQFQELVETPLQKSQNELLQKPPVVVLDALDECGSDSSRSDQRRTLLNSLTKWAGLPEAFKLVVTSRDKRLPASFRQVCQPIALETGSRVSQESSDDIQLFLKTRFAEIAEWFPSLGNWPGDSMIKELTRRASGLFILAETLVRFVGHGDSLPNERLHLVLSGDFGEEADSIKGLYRPILDVSFKDPKAHILDDRKARILNAFRAMVGTIVLAKIPLHRDHLPHFLHPPVEGPLIDLVLNKLSSVISIGKTEKLIHLCHLSFADFLFDPTQSPEYSIDRALHSQNLTSACFRLMKAGLKFNICNLETSHLLNDEVVDLPSRIQRSIPPSLSYACRFVAQHLRDTPHDGRDCGELLEDIRDFLYVRLLYWLEVMSLIKEVSVVPTTLNLMAIWAKTSDTDLTAFATDAVKFVVNFITPITESAPHIYLSAVPWSPRESKVAQHFLVEFPRTFSVFSGQDTRWPATINVLRGHTEGGHGGRFLRVQRRLNGKDQRQSR